MREERGVGNPHTKTSLEPRSTGSGFFFFVRCTADMISPNGVVIRIELQIGVSDCNTVGTQISGAYGIT